MKIEQHASQKVVEKTKPCTFSSPNEGINILADCIVIYNNCQHSQELFEDLSLYKRWFNLSHETDLLRGISLFSRKI